MKVELLKGDITKLSVDAIVNLADNYLSGGTPNYSGAIHTAAGPQLAEACKQLGLCRPGEAKITSGYDLMADYVIHTVGPVWRGGVIGEKNILTSCYIHSMQLAIERKLDTIAFPLLSAGPRGVPKKEALTVALSTLLQYQDEDIHITLVLGNTDTFMQANRIMAQLTLGNSYLKL